MLAALVAMLLIWVSNMVVADQPSFSARVLIFAAVVALVVTALLRSFTFIPRLMVSIYEFGNFKAIVILDETGCAIVRQQGFTLSSDTKADATSTSKTCSLPNVTILSRLGNAYYVKASRSGARPVRFTLPRQHVLSWAVNESKEPTPAGSPRAAP